MSKVDWADLVKGSDTDLGSLGELHSGFKSKLEEDGVTLSDVYAGDVIVNVKGNFGSSNVFRVVRKDSNSDWVDVCEVLESELEELEPEDGFSRGRVNLTELGIEFRTDVEYGIAGLSCSRVDTLDLDGDNVEKDIFVDDGYLVFKAHRVTLHSGIDDVRVRFNEGEKRELVDIVEMSKGETTSTVVYSEDPVTGEDNELTVWIGTGADYPPIEDEMHELNADYFGDDIEIYIHDNGTNVTGYGCHGGGNYKLVEYEYRDLEGEDDEDKNVLTVQFDGLSSNSGVDELYYSISKPDRGSWVDACSGILGEYPEVATVKDFSPGTEMYGFAFSGDLKEVLNPEKVIQADLYEFGNNINVKVVVDDGLLDKIIVKGNSKVEEFRYEEDGNEGGIKVKSVERKDVSRDNGITFERSTVTSKDILEEKKRIVDAGILTEDQVEYRISYMEACNVDELRMYNVLKKIDHVADEVKDLVPRLKVIYQDSAGLVPKCIGYINIGSNLMFEGEKGVGKNVLSETLAWLYNRPLFEFPMNSQHTNSSIFGTNTFGTEEVEIEDEELNKVIDRLEKEVKDMIDDGVEDISEINMALDKLALLKSGNNVQLVDTIEFKPSAIVQALQYGGFLVLDEFNTGVPEVLSALNGMLDYRSRLSVPGYGTVEAEEHFVAIGTQNKDYAGTTEQNKATTDRFTHILFPRRESLYDILITNYPEYEEEIQVYDRLYRGMLQLVDDRKLESSDISIRGFDTACAGLSQGMDMIELLEDNVVNKIENELSRECVQVLVNSL